MESTEISRPFTFWILDAQKRDLRYLSKIEDRSLGELIRESISEYLQRRLHSPQEVEKK